MHITAPEVTMRVVRVIRGDSSSEFLISPIADRTRLPLKPIVSFARKVSRVQRHRVPDAELERLADHVVSWDFTNHGEPATCSRSAVVAVLQWPEYRNPVAQAIDELTCDPVLLR